MPRSNKASGHQPNLQGIPTFYACVARPVTKKEQAGNDKARAALLKEWTKLRKLGCWGELGVREWKKVAAEARANGKTEAGEKRTIDAALRGSLSLIVMVLFYHLLRT